MRKILLLALTLLAVQTSVTAAGGRWPTRRSTLPVPSVASPKTMNTGPWAYAIAFNPVDALGGVQFGLLDIGSGTFQTISDLPNGAQGIARDDGEILVVDNDNNLVRINPVTGLTTVIGPTGVTTPGPKGETRVDVVASLATGEVFLMDYSNNLYSVDRKTGAAKLIGPTEIPPIISPSYASSFAGDCTSLYFTIQESDADFNPLVPPTLYRIDPRSGIATLVGPTSPIMVGAGFIGGTLYGFSVDDRLFGGTEPPHVVSIDTSTGAGTNISDLSVPGVGGAVRLAGPHGCHGE